MYEEKESEKEERKNICSYCGGTGEVEVDDGCEDDDSCYMETCRVCGGTGYED